MKTSLVTGGLGGIGRSIVNKLLERGDNVIVFDIQPECNIPNVTYYQVDISSVESIKDAFKKIDSLDVLVNNAGVTRDALAIRLKESDWDTVLNINLKGLFFCTQSAMQNMLKNKRGYIVNISSIVGQSGNPGQVNYAASKAGVVSLTKTLAAEYGSKNILVNAIAPGFIQTPMTDKLSQSVKEKVLDRIALRRFGNSDDVANLVNFLTSGQADYITGSVINVDGGIN